jgi:acyl-coenzyme A thioesterase PaaI-like protein
MAGDGRSYYLSITAGLEEKEEKMGAKAIQDNYPDELAHCYGCGRLNDHGLKIKSFWEGEESVCRYKPLAYHTGGTSFVYGGILTSLIDCHSSATASMADLRERGYSPHDDLPSRFVTASLKVDFLKPTPIGKVLELRSKVTAIKGRKIVVSTELSVAGNVCVKGEAVMVPGRLLEFQK